MRTTTHAATLLAALGLASLARCQHATGAATAPLPVELPQRLRADAFARELASPHAGPVRALRVDGVAVPAALVRREAVHAFGARLVAARIVDCGIEQYAAQAVKAGRDPKSLDLSERDLATALDRAADLLAGTEPGLDGAVARRLITCGDGAFLRDARRTVRFDRVFFPGSAKAWPEITRSAIMAGTCSSELWPNLEKATVDDRGNPCPLPAPWLSFWRRHIQKQLAQWSDIAYPSDGLPAEIALRVDGRSWPTEEAFAQLRPELRVSDLERATMAVVVREVLARELRAKGAYLDDAAFQREFDEFRQQYDCLPIGFEAVVIASGYPSVECYRQRRRLLDSFERTIADEVDDERLGTHARRFARDLGGGSVTVDLLRFPADGGAERARARAQAALEAIARGRPFAELVEDRGRAAERSLAEVRSALHESELTDLEAGRSVGRYLFFDAEVGRVVGPLRGPDAWFLARVRARGEPAAEPPLEDPPTRELVRKDYVAWRFVQWAQEIVARARIE